MSQENVEIVRRAHDAFNARDLDRLLGLSAEDREWLPLLQRGRIWRIVSHSDPDAALAALGPSE
jgi:ketosteroid isomerase-like protein